MILNYDALFDIYPKLVRRYLGMACLFLLGFLQPYLSFAQLTCPVNATASSPCLTQAQLTAQYNAWLATASGSGGCGGVLTNNSPGAPSICSATAISQTVEFTYTSTCEPFTTTCQSTFTVPAYPDFNGPPNSGATRVCLAQTEQPIPPVISDACGKPITPTGPVVVDAPNPLTCEGTRTYTYTYTDCAGHSKDWSFVWTLNVPTLSVDLPGTFTVPCPSFTPPTYPNTITDACGRPVTATGPTVTSSPDPITCEGTKTFTWNLTDCAGNTNTWSWIVTIERNDFTLPANGGSTVACPAAANVVPTPPSKMSECGEPIIPTGPVVSATPACEGTKTYTWTYTDCEGNSHDWVYTYTIERNDFTVPANGSATVSCPADITTPTPPTVTSNCGETLTPTGPVVVNTPDPLTCAGTRVYTYTYTDCEGNTRTWSFTYMVSPTLPVTITCPTNTTTTACQTPVQLNTAYSNWLNTASFSGGCNGSLTSTQGVPLVCGSSTTLTFTHINACGNQSCQATFTVPAPPPVVLNCPSSQNEAFGQTQAAINAKFATWLATATGSGGCNGVLTNNNTGAPPASGGTTTVTFTYTSSCTPLTTTCQATFTVSSVPPVVLTCPTNTTTTACQTQAAVNAAFASWLATASASGGCNGVLMNNNTGAPSACGGSTTVTFTYTSTCVPTTTTCQATFIVASAPPVVLSCPTNTTSAACRTQAAVNTAFATWLASASASGGCNGVLTNNNTGAPSACGGSTTVTFTYTSTCVPTTTTCQATFIVASAPPVVLTCPYNTTYAACQTQAAVNTAFATWLASASASGGCNGVLTNNNTGAPSAAGGSTTVTFTYTSTCVPFTTTCQATFAVASPTLVCGWSAEPNGVGCNNGNSVSYNNSTQTFSVNSNNCQINFPYTSDAHAFAQTTLCGDGSITTLVNQASMSSNALAGLIMRETTMAGAKKAQLTINKAGMSSSSFRDVNNASATFLANAHINHFWLRITRTGNVFSTFVSLDGTTWKPVGTKTIPMASCINMGLIVHTSNVQMMIPPSTQGTASFSNTSTTGSGSAPVRPNNIGTNFDQLAIADFKISPNPTYGLTDIDLSAYSKTQVQLDIMSLQGTLLRTTVIEAGAEREQMDLSGFSSGMYLIRARAEGLPDVTKRLVVGTTP
ncbi:MAG: T9SS type A sorting domain-containing protein [Saprospiraceae bacterium]|nr:T9SS type A sorting domain-containing protein [Saprospiraceae bacterium]